MVRIFQWNRKMLAIKMIKCSRILRPMKNNFKLGFVPWKNVWFCFIFVVFRWLWTVLDTGQAYQTYFKVIEIFCYFLINRKWCHIWIYLVKQCLIWFNLRCLHSILVIYWQIRILNFIEIIQNFSMKESVVRSKLVPGFLSYLCSGIIIKIVSNLKSFQWF